MTATPSPPVPTATPEGQVIGRGPVQTYETTPLDEAPVLDFPPIVFDVQTQSVVLPDDAAYAEAAGSLVRNALYQSERSLALRSPDGSWREARVPPGIDEVVASPDGVTAAISVAQQTVLLDIASASGPALTGFSRPLSFSPDGALLLVLTPSQYVVVPVDEVESAYALPNTDEGDQDTFLQPLWLDDRTLALARGREPLLQLFDLSGAGPTVIVEQAVPVAIMSLSRDGGRIAIDQDGTTIYDLPSFEVVATLPGASLGNQYYVSHDVWNADGSRIVVSFDVCGDDERLVAIDLASGADTVLARGGMMRWAYSPDDAWVAYHGWPDEAYVVAADGSSAPVFVSDDVHAPADPSWSADSRYAAFPRMFGGYDRCLS